MLLIQLPSLSVNTMPLYLIHAASNWCIVDMTSVGIGITFSGV